MKNKLLYNSTDQCIPAACFLPPRYRFTKHTITNKNRYEYKKMAWLRVED